ncbi:S-locus lectin protein kinase family protein [Hibiscus syriacus]|uniref:S-locus lectin protein kinase family protein n=1 Tax=Hibiscus syriacus TaxID=106335 RepID=A0A6A2Z9T1_HIBSY|nr:S-locus lectin protein kinase family protein [Hibiscus syriacus]
MNPHPMGNRKRLCYLLDKLVKKHDWGEASGVLSLLLRGTSNDCSADLNRLKYSVSIRLLKNTDGDNVDLRRIRDIYEIWMSRIKTKTVEVEEQIALHLFIFLSCTWESGLGTSSCFKLNERTQMLNNHYNDAVKYLWLALQCEPPLSAALLPLVQLLLIGGQVNEALSEEILKDPTCCHSLGRLVIMHQNGYYSLDSLVEMIALRVEATFPESDTWREFASCFLKLYQYEEDLLSICLNGDEGGG